MEEILRDKPEEEKLARPLPALKPGGPGITITPVTSPSSPPTTPLPRVSVPPPFSPLPKTASKEKHQITSFLLLLIIILNIISLVGLIAISLDKIPGFLARP